MSSAISGLLQTSNDLLRRLMAKHGEVDLDYQVVAQSTDDVHDSGNSPAVSMGHYLLESGQTGLLNRISIYSLRGESREQRRLLYMNAIAMRIWTEMGKIPRIIGAQNFPPRAAILTLGIPFNR